MRIVIADRDSSHGGGLAATLRGKGYRVVVAQDEADALGFARHPRAPFLLLLLDWGPSGAAGVELCRRVREQNQAAYVVLMAPPHETYDLPAAMAAGADDFLSWSCTPDDLVKRVQVGERTLRSRALRSTSVRQILQEATGRAGSEVVVREGESIGRVFFFQGLVVWVHLSDEQGAFVELIRDQAQLSEADLQPVIEECRRTGRHFGEVLIEWGMVDPTSFREGLRVWLARRLQTLLDLAQPEVFLVPQTRAFASKMTFTLGELLPPESPDPGQGRLSSRPPPGLAAEPAGSALADWVGPLLAQVIQVDGVLGAAVSGPLERGIVAQVGEPVDHHVTSAQRRLLEQLGEERPEDVWISSARRYHLARLLPQVGGHALHVVGDRERSTLAILRLELGRLTEKVGQP